MSESESAFGDAEEAQDERPAAFSKKAQRQRSISDMLSTGTQGKRKRVLQSPDAATSDTLSDLKQTLLAEMKTAIESTINAAVSRMLQKLDAKLDSKLSMLQNRCEKLEGENFDKDIKIERLENQLRLFQLTVDEHEDQIDALERQSRASNLILTSEQFGRRRDNEDISQEAADILNAYFPSKHISKEDFVTVHRLGEANTVICAFVRRSLKEELYRARLTLNSEPDAKMKLYLSESLTKAKSLIYKQLVNMKRQDRVWSIFSRNGIPAYKLTKDSRPAFIYTQQQMDNLLHGAPPPGAAGRRAAHGVGGARAAHGTGGARAAHGARGGGGATGDRTRKGGGSRGLDVNMGRGGGDMDGSRRQDVRRGSHGDRDMDVSRGTGTVMASCGTVNADVSNDAINVDVSRGEANVDMSRGGIDVDMSHSSASANVGGGDAGEDAGRAVSVTGPAGT